MEPASHASPTPSATVLLLRDAPDGLQVLLLKRHARSNVLGGVYVFPGGKLDANDAGLVDRLDQPLAKLQDCLGEPHLSEVEAGALYVAAIREVFEEAGVLFAAGTLTGATNPRRSPRPLEEVLDSGSASLASAQLSPWARWITPVETVMVRKRFDARFFVAALPPGQEPMHDDHEATQSLWLDPKSALGGFWRGQIQLVPPQIMSLAQMAHYRCVDDVLAAARGRKPPCIRPEVLVADGGRILAFPGDDRHPERARALPGPTRLVWRNDRWEPANGVEALFE